MIVFLTSQLSAIISRERDDQRLAGLIFGSDLAAGTNAIKFEATARCGSPDHSALIPPLPS